MRGVRQAIESWDTHLFLRVFNWNGRLTWDRLFILLSRSADGPLYALLAPFLLLTGPAEAVPVLGGALVAFGLELPLYALLKRGVRRDRPFRRLVGVRFLIAPPDHFSFPSGHTAAAVIVACALAAACPVLSLPAAVWVAGVGLSRVYLGVHYPTDVLFGAFLGFACARLGQLLAG